MLNKILITIQGKTLILYYRINHALKITDKPYSAYIEVQASKDLSLFNLKGLSTEMFVQNISDMVNIQGVFSGEIENEQQVTIARWTLNKEEYLEAIKSSKPNFTHSELVEILKTLPSFVREKDNQYIDFEECVVSHNTTEKNSCSGYRLSLVTESIESDINSYIYYTLDTRTPQGWQESIPPQSHYKAIQNAINTLIATIQSKGVKITQINDETDYALTN